MPGLSSRIPMSIRYFSAASVHRLILFNVRQSTLRSSWLFAWSELSIAGFSTRALLQAYSGLNSPSHLVLWASVLMVALICAPEASASPDNCIIVACVAQALANTEGGVFGLPLFLGDTPTSPLWTALVRVVFFILLSFEDLKRYSLFFLATALAPKPWLTWLPLEILVLNYIVVAFQDVEYCVS